MIRLPEEEWKEYKFDRIRFNELAGWTRLIPLVQLTSVKKNSGEEIRESGMNYIGAINYPKTRESARELFDKTMKLLFRREDHRTVS